MIIVVNKARLEKHLKTFSTFTATPKEGMTRFSYSPEDMKTRKYIKKKMRAYGLSVREDGLGNIFGKFEGKLPNAQSVIVGLHYDLVSPCGNYYGDII